MKKKKSKILLKIFQLILNFFNKKKSKKKKVNHFLQLIN